MLLPGSERAGNHAREASIPRARRAASSGLVKQLEAGEAGARGDLYIPMAWYPLSTYKVVPVTLLASSERR